jgi:hypothetical protein
MGSLLSPYMTTVTFGIDIQVAEHPIIVVSGGHSSVFYTYSLEKVFLASQSTIIPKESLLFTLHFFLKSCTHT